MTGVGIASDELPGGEAGDARSEDMVCLLCGHGKRGEVNPLRMTHGVVVWLCPVHGDPDYLRRRQGRTFVERLTALWKAAGALTARRTAALAAHRTRMIGAPKVDLPGSYSWPDLRRDAEERFAAGEEVATVIADLRARYATCPARVPSIRTMRRWHADGRWFTNRPREPRRAVLGIRRPLASRWDGIIPFHMGSFALVNLWWIEDRPPYRWRN